MRSQLKKAPGLIAMFALAVVCVWTIPFVSSSSDAFAAPQGKHIAARMTFAPITIPTQVPLVSVCAGGAPHCATLTWVAPTANLDGTPIVGAITYDVMRATVDGGPYTKVTAAPISGTAFEDDSVLGGTTYFYVVVAYGNNSPTPSPNSVQARTAIPPSQIGPPTGLVAVPKQ